MNVSESKPRRYSSFELLSPGGSDSKKQHQSSRQSKIFDDPAVIQGYESVPLIEVDVLPRGGISLETNAVGRIQFGIPPETIKDSMLLGMEVPSTYIVPVERFCREMGPALGINLAEFEFPAYFNYFVRSKRCALVVDAPDAERDIRNVFGETLLGPEHYRNHQYPCANMDEDFDPSFPKDARPNFYKEFYNFRTAEKSTNYQELSIDTLLEFVHFKSCRHHDQNQKDKLGVPPTPAEFEMGVKEFDGSLRASEPNVSSSHLSLSHAARRHSDVSGNAEDDMYINMSSSVGKKEFDNVEGMRPGLERSTSDSSCSASETHASRRNSMGSIGSSGQKGSIRGERRGSLPVNAGNANDTRRNSLPVNDSPLSRGSVMTFEGRRDSLKSANSEITNLTRRSGHTRVSKLSAASSSIYPYDFMVDEDDADQESHWMYSQAKWLGEVATVYPTDATDEQKRTNTCARAEIFKMAGGTEYIVHDVGEDNIIIGKARFSGTVRTPDELSVEGFISNEGMIDDLTDRVDDDDFEEDDDRPVSRISAAPTFHPPSFGVTVLGNSHGFDKNGSTSGYVLWVNGRGIMIDPPPYSSATLEREGIRPQMIMAIIITHCHADHDAGAFQKVMTGSRVAIITTPTIYKSFIRKYSALSGLRPTLLRHSHRHRPAIIGQPLRFQGAVFHFTYTLHTIPCLSFKVEWRGRSIVFTGDHMNIPSQIQILEEKGVLTKARADDLRQLPIQDCDVLLHEAGAPPIHTPLTVLEELPQHVKDRLYVVHTAAIPPDSSLKVAPTGTAGTIRLDSFHNNNKSTLGHRLPGGANTNGESHQNGHSAKIIENSTNGPSSITAESLQDGANQNLTVLGGHNPAVSNTLINQFNGKNGRARVAPLVFLRPTDVSDAWFILNLLSAVPFLSSLSYAHTMEFLEIAHVEMYSSGEVVIEGHRRSEVLCVFWEGTCVERGGDIDDTCENLDSNGPTVWHAGDWTGPVSLQPDAQRSAHVAPGEIPKDIVAVPLEGVKVITLLMKDVQRILKSGSKLFRKYLALQERQKAEEAQRQQQLSHQMYYDPTFQQTKRDNSSDNLLDVIQCNSVLSNLTAMQKRYLESLADPRFFATHTPLWKIGDPVDYAYIIVSGTATLGRKSVPIRHSRMNRRGSTGAMSGALGSIDESGRGDPRQIQPIVPVEADKLLPSEHANSEFAKLEVTLQLRSEEMEASIQVMESTDEYGRSILLPRADPAQLHRDRFANKVLARLYSRRAYTENLIFSRGNFLSDTSRMVSGDLANIHRSAGMGSARSSIGTSSSSDHHSHTSNLMAGPLGCVVMVFPRTTLVPFLDSNPGVLLSLLGSQVVV